MSIYPRVELQFFGLRIQRPKMREDLWVALNWTHPNLFLIYSGSLRAESFELPHGKTRSLWSKIAVSIEQTCTYWLRTITRRIEAFDRATNVDRVASKKYDYYSSSWPIFVFFIFVNTQEAQGVVCQSSAQTLDVIGDLPTTYGFPDEPICSHPCI